MMRCSFSFLYSTDTNGTRRCAWNWKYKAHSYFKLSFPGGQGSSVVSSKPQLWLLQVRARFPMGKASAGWWGRGPQRGVCVGECECWVRSALPSHMEGTAPSWPALSNSLSRSLFLFFSPWNCLSPLPLLPLVVSELFPLQLWMSSRIFSIVWSPNQAQSSWKSASQSVLCGPAALSSPGNVLDVFGSHPICTKQDTGCMWRAARCSALQVILMSAHAGNYCFGENWETPNT